MSMGRFFNGILVGIGIGLLAAPRKGEEMRGMLGERISQIRSTLPNYGTSSSSNQSSEDVETDNYMKPIEANQPKAASVTTPRSPLTDSSQINENMESIPVVRSPDDPTLTSNTNVNELNRRGPSSTRDTGSRDRDVGSRRKNP